MTQEAGNTIDIYNILLEGKILYFEFATLTEANKCYANVAVVKHRQDKLAEQAGIYSKVDTGRLTRKLEEITKEAPEGAYSIIGMTLKLDTTEVPIKKYNYTIIENSTEQ